MENDVPRMFVLVYRRIHAMKFFLDTVDGYKLHSATWCSIVYCSKMYPTEATEQRADHISKYFSLMYLFSGLPSTRKMREVREMQKAREMRKALTCSFLSRAHQGPR